MNRCSLHPLIKIPCPICIEQEEYCPLHPQRHKPCDICTGVDDYAPANDYEKCIHGISLFRICFQCQDNGLRERIYKPKSNVTGSNNPHYEFARPVNNLQELVDVIDPNMDYKRYNILKSAIRLLEDEEYNYQKINYYSNPDLREVSTEKENR